MSKVTKRKYKTDLVIGLCGECQSERFLSERTVICECGKTELTWKLSTSVRRLARKLKEVKSADFDAFIIDNQDMLIADVATILGVSESYVQNRRYKLIQVASRTILWTEEEDSFIAKNRNLPWSWVASQMDRSSNSVRVRARRLGLEKFNHANDATLSEIAKYHQEGLTTSQIGEKLGRSGENIRINLSKLGIKPNKLDTRARYLKILKSIEAKGFSSLAESREHKKSVAVSKALGTDPSLSSGEQCLYEAIRRNEPCCSAKVKEELVKIKCNTGLPYCPTNLGGLVQKLAAKGLISINKLPHSAGRGKATYRILK